MLKIKLARFGKKRQPHYRIVVNEARDKRDGSYVAAIGHYGPTQQPKILTLDLEAYKDWIKKGAQPTETVAALATRFESGNPFPARPAQPSKKAKAKAAAAAQAAAEAEAASKEASPVAENEASVSEAATSEVAETSTETTETTS